MQKMSYQKDEIGFISVLNLLIYITFSLQGVFAVDCNFTHLEYFGKYSLGKQDELNKTFTIIQPLVHVTTVTQTIDSNKWTIKNMEIQFSYIDSRQKAAVIGKDTVAIYGGFVRVGVRFDWVKQNMVSYLEGSGYATVLSDEILFQKTLKIDKGYLDYQLSYYYNVSLHSSNFTLNRVNPPTTSASDVDSILMVMNVEKIDDSVKTVTLKQLSIFFGTTLAENIKNQHYPLDSDFNYTWINQWTKESRTIQYRFIPTGVDLEIDGLTMNYVSYIDNDSDWVCGGNIPVIERDPSIYGETQQFVSFSIFSNTIRYALTKGFLNTNLNRLAWQSRLFQFFAGDLYQVIPQIANKFSAQQIITGQCTGTNKVAPTLIMHNNTFLNSSTSFNCKLQVKPVQIAEFDVKLNLQIQIHPNETNLNFKVVAAQAEPTFKSISVFEIKNSILAAKMVEHSLNRLKEGFVFGSGWKIFPRDYSHVEVNKDYLFIYDSTHVREF